MIMRAKNEAAITAEHLYEQVRDNEFNFDYVLQRDGGQWTANQKNKFIDTLLNGYAVPDIWYLEDSETQIKTVVDGKQRLTTVFSYMNDEWKLAKSFESVYYDNKFYDVAGKKFSELDSQMQKLIKRYLFTFKSLTGYTDEQVEEQFLRLNSGTSFKPTQKARVALGTQIAPKFDEKILDLPFWDRCASSIANSKTDAKLGVALECLMLLTDYETKSYGSPDVIKFAEYYKDNYKDSDLDELALLLNKLDEYYPTDEECVPYLKKLHIPALVICMKQFLEIQSGKVKFNGIVKFNFTEEDFENWLYKWTTEVYRGQYTENGCKDGTTKKPKVEARVDIICTLLLTAAEGKIIRLITSIKGNDFDWKNGDYSFLTESVLAGNGIDDGIADDINNYDSPADNILDAEIIENDIDDMPNDLCTVDDIINSVDLDEEIIEMKELESEVYVQADEEGAVYHADAS